MDELRLPGMLVRFRPTGPWRIGPDSGARDRVDQIFHSDALYSAVCSAMDQLGLLPDWLQATAQAQGEPAVCFSSCFPWQEDELFVVPPRNLWPPPPSAKVRWKGARFVPLSLVSLLLTEKPLDEERWAVDPVSECLLPAQRRFASGPFRVSVRSFAAVDRLSHGANSIHSTACLEFADRAGMWCAVAFSSEESRQRWAGPVKSALRLLADSGLGGERSRGWGRSLSPSITEGTIPSLLLPKLSRPARPSEAATTFVENEPPAPAQNEANPEPPLDTPVQNEPNPQPPAEAASPELIETAPEPPSEPVLENEPAAEPENEPSAEIPLPLPDEAVPGEPPAEPENEPGAPVPSEAESENEPTAETALPQPEEAAPGQPAAESENEPAAVPPEPETAEASVLSPAVEQPLRVERAASEPPVVPPAPPAPGTAWWLLSLFSPAPADSVDWQRGNYATLTRTGRIESSAQWGDLKKSVRMIAEGSVVIALAAPRGGAPDVAPDGFPHPVFRSGFAFAIPIPWRMSQ